MSKLHIHKLSHRPEQKNIILIHGNSSSSKIWRDLCLELIESFNITVVDLPGHGISPKPDHLIYSLSELSEILFNEISSLKLKEFSLVAHSLGANIVAQKLVQYSQIGLEQFMPLSFLPLQGPETLTKGLKPNENAATYSSELVKDEELENLFHFSFLKRDSELFNNFSHDFRRTDTAFREKLANNLFEGDFNDEKKAIRSAACKTTLLYGEKEQFLNMDYIIEDKASPLISIIPQSGHYIQTDNPQTLASLILQGHYKSADRAKVGFCEVNI